MPALAPAERKVLRAVVEALVPRLQPREGDDARLFGLSGESSGVPEEIERVLLTVGAEQREEFRKLLRALDRRWSMLLLGGTFSRFASLDLEARQRVLRAMSVSPLPPARSAFQALKRLTTFLFYALVDEKGSNPTWGAIGYQPSPNPPATTSPLRLTAIVAATRLDCDVCVIGSGAGGSVVAADAARRGKKVVVLEAGPGDQSPDFDQREIVGMRRLFLDQGFTATSDLGIGILAGATLGGGTTVNWQTSLRTPDDVRDEWADRSGCEFFRDASFSASLDAVCERLGVGTDESVLNRSNQTLREGCARLGYDWTVTPRNARGCDFDQCGHCMFGCRKGGKQGAAETFLRDAQRLGDTSIIASCRATRIVWGNGTVQGVEAVATDPSSGARHPVRVDARTVVLAAGGIGSPVLLERSGIRHPELGRNLFLHPTGAVGAVYAEPVRLWSGAPQTVVCNEFSSVFGSYGFRLEAVPGHPGLMALAVPWLDARDHRRRMQQYDRVAATIVLVRDRSSGRVTVTRSGRTVIEYQLGRQERALMRMGTAAAARVHVAAGAEEVLILDSAGQSIRNPATASPSVLQSFYQRIDGLPVGRNRSAVFSAHQMGTCRMGSDPRKAVCDPSGEVFGVRGLFVADASAFPGSSGVNPMITIMAVAACIARVVGDR